ncbi:MATE family efflux transporter [Algiphilus sp.]|uniref:MATE family efflux transporter n=1 Tax=Algiphilus sp. TaxID=1872431 RepID=UPI003B520439
MEQAGEAVPGPGYRRILQLAWPIMLANCSTPLLGLSDTAVIGRSGTTAELGAIALGALLFSFLYWGFGFLRMGTTGFAARADGEQDEAEVRASIQRALLLSLLLASGLLLLQRPLIDLALALFGASDSVETLTADYFAWRIWGAPAALALYALMGLFIGLGQTRWILLVQLSLNGLNILLDILFAGVLGWGVRGIAIGTALAEWLALLLALMLALRLLRARHQDGAPFLVWSRLRDGRRWRQTLTANGDIMLRTLLMLSAFAWFTNQGARFGDVTLAANHVLLQFISFSAFFLDGYAHAVEPLVGRALGGRRLDILRAAARRSTHLAAATAMLLALAVLLAGGLAITGLTAIEAVRSEAERYLPFAAAYVLLSFAAFQLDGIFIGAGWTRAMRNGSLAAVAAFLATAMMLVPVLGNAGLWLAFIGYVVYRALTLAAYLPILLPQRAEGTA